MELPTVGWGRRRNLPKWIKDKPGDKEFGPAQKQRGLSLEGLLLFRMAEDLVPRVHKTSYYEKIKWKGIRIEEKTGTWIKRKREDVEKARQFGLTKGTAQT